MIEYNEKVTARKVISICNLKVSRRTMQRELHDNDYVYGNITKRICLSEVDKISRVEICKTWLKTRVDFAKVVMTDEKLFRLDGPNNWFSYHGKGKMKQKRLLRHSGGNGLMLHCTCLPDGSLKFHFCSKILTGDYYMELLDSVVIPFIKTSLKNDFFLQHDGAPIHRASVVTQYLTRNKIHVLKSPI